MGPYRILFVPLIVLFALKINAYPSNKESFHSGNNKEANRELNEHNSKIENNSNDETILVNDDVSSDSHDHLENDENKQEEVNATQIVKSKKLDGKRDVAVTVSNDKEKKLNNDLTSTEKNVESIDIKNNSRTESPKKEKSETISEEERNKKNNESDVDLKSTIDEEKHNDIFTRSPINESATNAKSKNEIVIEIPNKEEKHNKIIEHDHDSNNKQDNKDVLIKQTEGNLTSNVQEQGNETQTKTIHESVVSKSNENEDTVQKISNNAVTISTDEPASKLKNIEDNKTEAHGRVEEENISNENNFKNINVVAKTVSKTPIAADRIQENIVPNPNEDEDAVQKSSIITETVSNETQESKLKDVEESKSKAHENEDDTITQDNNSRNLDGTEETVSRTPIAAGRKLKFKSIISFFTKIPLNNVETNMNKNWQNDIFAYVNKLRETKYSKSQEEKNYENDSDVADVKKNQVEKSEISYSEDKSITKADISKENLYKHNNVKSEPNIEKSEQNDVKSEPNNVKSKPIAVNSEPSEVKSESNNVKNEINNVKSKVNNVNNRILLGSKTIDLIVDRIIRLIRALFFPNSLPDDARPPIATGYGRYRLDMARQAAFNDAENNIDSRFQKTFERTHIVDTNDDNSNLDEDSSDKNAEEDVDETEDKVKTETNQIKKDKSKEFDKEKPYTIVGNVADKAIGHIGNIFDGLSRSYKDTLMFGHDNASRF